MANDPVGEMLTRIRNGQLRRRSVVQTSGSKLRKSVLDVLKSEGYIRDYATTDLGNGRTEFAVELKYYDGQPVIRSIQGVSKRSHAIGSTFTVADSAQMQMDRLPASDKKALTKLFSSDEINKPENTRKTSAGLFASRLGERRVLWQPGENGQAEILSVVDRSYAD